MTYKSFGLAALLVGALRSAVADPALQEQVDAQQGQIEGVRGAFDGLTGRLSAIETAIADNGTLDADQAADLAGIKGELADLATALTGPRDTPDDNGVIAEVAPVETAPVSDAATAIAEAAPETAAEEG